MCSFQDWRTKEDHWNSEDKKSTGKCASFQMDCDKNKVAFFKQESIMDQFFFIYLAYKEVA